MNKARLPVWLAALAAAAFTLICMAPTEARPPVSVHVGVGVGYPGPMRAWHGGYRHRGWYGPGFGWWGGVGPVWYNYPAAVYPYPYAYPNTYPYGPPVVVQTAPATPGPAPAQYWYYCAASRAYYPYVAECPGGWLPVPTTPTPPPPAASRPGR